MSDKEKELEEKLKEKDKKIKEQEILIKILRLKTRPRSLSFYRRRFNA